MRLRLTSYPYIISSSRSTETNTWFFLLRTENDYTYSDSCKDCLDQDLARFRRELQELVSLSNLDGLEDSVWKRLFIVIVIIIFIVIIISGRRQQPVGIIKGSTGSSWSSSNSSSGKRCAGNEHRGNTWFDYL